MNSPLPKLFLLLLFLSLISYTRVTAQNNPSDLSRTQVDELSDGQVLQMMRQAGNSGISDTQLVELAQKRGLPDDEAIKLKSRIGNLRQGSQGNTASNFNDTIDGRRKINYQPDTQRSKNNKSPLAGIFPKIFGSDIFSNGNLTFSPNLRLATPVNYIVGPDDRLNINVYGNSVVNWKLEVSPEGNINIPGAGLLNVSGKTIEQATNDIKRKLAANNYAIGRGTTVQVSLGDIRSIKVILIGDVNRPGSYTLPSLATAFNALYAAGGPNANGTYRQIEIIRDNRIIRTLDVYDFLVKGDQKNNVGLQDQDIVRVPSYRTRVELSGEVKNPAIFEVLPGETLADVIKFAGGFTNEAYTGRIKILQVNEQQRRVTDVIENDFKNYVPLRGDKYIVDRVLDRFENRVTINGAVFRPGVYELDKGLTISGLIAKSAGLKEDAFTGRASITRLNADNTKQLIPVDIRGVLNKSAADIPLQREDSVYISSIFELKDKYNVTIKGEVRNPGSFVYADSMKVADLIIKAGGFAEGASPLRIEVSQRINNSNPNAVNGQVAIVYSVNLDANLNLSKVGFTLHPYDIVSVYGLPGYEKQRTVKIEGEVLYPGYYTLKTKNEKISDLIARAGNLTILADASGSSLRRTNTAILGIDKNKTDSVSTQRERAQQLQHLQSSFKDSSVVYNQQLRNNYIGINLKEIIEKPGSVTDLILQDEDVLRVPRQQQIVRINGEVLYPSAVVYESGKSFNDFVSNAGGYSPRALKKGAYIVYPNGTVKATRKFLFFNSHPEVKPGSEIYVPQKPAPKAGATQEVIGLTTGLASLGAIILGIISLRK
jgi:protein involved in polysaccharide export with SLBB domain